MIKCLLCRVGRENPAQVKDGLRFRVVPIDRFHRLGHLRAERLPPSTASHSRGSLHYGNASSLIGGNLSLKEAWGLSFMVGMGIRPKSSIGFMPWPMPPGRAKAVRIPSAPGYANGSTSLSEIAESCASRKAL